MLALAALAALRLALAADPAPSDPAPSDPAPARPAAPAAVSLDVVHLTDGQILEGTLVLEEPTRVVLRLADGQDLPIPRAVIDRLTQRRAAVGTLGTHGIDPNRGRYFYAPSAFPLGRGNVTLAQRALVLTTAAVGVFPGVDLEVGTVIPTLFIRGGQVGVVGAKGGVRVSERVRLGAGAQGFAFSENVGGFAFSTLTVGEPDLHVSVNGGVAMDFLNPGAPVGVLAASVSRRFSKKFAFVSENWFLWFSNGEGPWGVPLFVVPSGGVRVFGGGFAVDIGLVPVFTGTSDLPVLPLPWVSFVGNVRTSEAAR